MLPCWKQKRSIVNSNNKKEEIYFQLQMNVNWRNKGRWLLVAVNFCCCWLREYTRIKTCIQATTAAGMCIVLKQNVTNLTLPICDWPFRLREVYSTQRHIYTPTISIFYSKTHLHTNHNQTSLRLRRPKGCVMFLCWVCKLWYVWPRITLTVTENQLVSLFNINVASSHEDTTRQ